MNKKTLRVIAVLTLVAGLSLAFASPASAAPVVLGDPPVLLAWFGGASLWAAVQEIVSEVLGKDGGFIDESGSSQTGNGTGD